MRRRTNYRFEVRPSLSSLTTPRGGNLSGGYDGTFAGREIDCESGALAIARAKQLVLDPAYPSRETLERVAGLLAQWLHDHAA